MYYKMPDDSYAAKPADCVWIKDAQGYVVIAYGPRLKDFYVIPVEEIVELNNTGAVSITEAMASQLGTHHVLPVSR